MRPYILKGRLKNSYKPCQRNFHECRKFFHGNLNQKVKLDRFKQTHSTAWANTEKLEKNTMDTSSDENGNTLLHYAAHAANLDTVLELLRDGHDILCPNARCPFTYTTLYFVQAGLTPLHFAAFGGNLPVLKTFLSASPHAINQQSTFKGLSLLHEAVRGKSPKTIKYLLDAGANANLQDQNGNTPLHLAASLRDGPASSIICQELLKRGANPTLQNQEKENFIFALLKRSARESLECLISLALQYQTDLLSKNMDGLTALDKARQTSAPSNVIRLIQKKTQEEQKRFLNQLSLPHPVKEVGKQIQSQGPVKKMKLIICGHSGVGKTTFANTLKETGLLSRLFYGSQTPPSTQGVSCSQAALKDGSLVIWDFAGQMEYCFTHSLLLNTSGPNTIYCVVFSLKGIESDQHGGQRQAIEQMIFWMRFLSVTYNPISTPHVILIGSHLDTLPNEDCTLIANRFYENVMKEEAELFGCFQKQFFPINCKNVENLLFLPQFIVSGSDTHPAMPSGVVILDVKWLLQEVFASFGNFALSPASGMDKQLWSVEEVVGALNLINGEEDADAALELLETLELLLKTEEGDFVVPAWLKRRGPLKKQSENIRGVGYFWRNDSRVFFSCFFVGRLQIQLVRQYGKQVCKLWKQGALLYLNAQLEIEVSEDKQSLYLFGSWRKKDNEGHCFNLLEEVEGIVETLLRKERNQNYEKLYLCPTDLNKLTEPLCTNCMTCGPGIDKIKGFHFEQILDAEKNNTFICDSNVHPWEVLFPHHDKRILRKLEWKCSIHWLEASTLETLCLLLDREHPLCLDWRKLAELLGNATISIVLEIEQEANNNRSSCTSLVLNRYPVTIQQLKKALSEMKRDDCTDAIERMMTNLYC
ncbi:uncharacterized protein PAF06_009647 [Gastrophryne carolinensis]